MWRENQNKSRNSNNTTLGVNTSQFNENRPSILIDNIPSQYNYHKLPIKARGINSFLDILRRSQERRKNEGIQNKPVVNKYTNYSLLKNGENYNSAQIIHPFKNKSIRESTI